MGGELFLAAVGGCFMSNLLAAIRTRGSKVSGVQTKVTGHIADAPARFEALELLVTADAEDPQELNHLIQIADRGCIMMNTLRDKLEIRVRTGATSKSAGD